MAGNVRALTKNELDFLNEKYSFELLDRYIIVSCKGLNRKVLHEIDKSFSLNSPVRKINISREAIDMWINNFKDECSLIDVQNAINSLIVTYQDISISDIKKVLKKNGTLINVI